MASSPFTADGAAALPGPAWLRARRTEAWERFDAAPRPTDAEEVWRYSRIGELDLEAYSPVPAADHDGALPTDLAEVVDAVVPRAGLLVLHNGRITRTELDPALAAQGVVLGSLVDAPDGDTLLGSIARPVDVFIELATAYLADAVVVSVPAGVVVDHPIVVSHLVDAPGGAVFPRLVVSVGENAQLTVVDHLVSPEGQAALVVPVVELAVGDAARLRYLAIQQLGTSAWQLGHQASRVGRDATLSSTVMALGGDYARLRADSRLAGAGGTSELLAAYFGDGHQMHDFRTMQDHAAPKTTSDLLFKGAVDDDSAAVYSGLIRVRPGAAGTNAFQTNRNLVLGAGAHADSVPNLEIEENDVRCSHASAVGPVDEDQRYYLESRGIPPEVADRLIVLGFFAEVVERSPVAGLHPLLRRALAAKLPAVQR